MTRDEEIEKEAIRQTEIKEQATRWEWSSHGDQHVNGFISGARWADSTSPYKKALERAVEALKKIKCQKCEDGFWVHFENAALNTSAMSNIRGPNIWNTVAELQKTLAEIQNLLEGKRAGEGD